MRCIQREGSLEIAGRYRPDVVILDVNMPEMDGLQTAQQLKKERRLQRVSFVAHSAADDPLITDAAERIGFRHFVTKGEVASTTAICSTHYQKSAIARADSMPRFLCLICCYSTPMTAYIANILTSYLHCTQGVPGARGIERYSSMRPVLMTNGRSFVAISCRRYPLIETN